MIIVRLLSTRAFWLVWHHQAYSGTGAGFVMKSISPLTARTGSLPLLSPIGSFDNLANGVYCTGEKKEGSAQRETTQAILVRHELSPCFSRLHRCYRGLLRPHRHTIHQGRRQRFPDRK